MSALAAGTSNAQYLWFLSRGSGIVLLVLLSAAPRWLARFAVAELHRTMSLFAVALLVLHVVTAMLDPYVSIGWSATVLPFLSHYRPLAIGLGTLAVDLGGAVLLTSLMRARLGFRAWRAVHWLAYLAWPVAFIHSLTAGGDLGTWWVALAECGSAAMVATAVIARLLLRRDRSAPPTAAVPSDRRVSHR
jgi:sulfoxide reductase heme-binding subunit YedZ